MGVYLDCLKSQKLASHFPISAKFEDFFVSLFMDPYFWRIRFQNGNPKFSRAKTFLAIGGELSLK